MKKDKHWKILHFASK